MTMTDQKKLLRKLDIESGLRQMVLEKEYQALRAQMVAKHGIEAVERSEAAVQDGEGISLLLERWGR
jgi:hypothetical protein